MMDIDHFKGFNDHYGHAGGDQCLRQVAQALALCVRRATDLLARYGGEEFACILPRTDAEGALTLAEQMRAALEAMAMPHAQSSAAPFVTISSGFTTLVPSHEAQPEELIMAADKCLYQAKRAGRNRVGRPEENMGGCTRPHGGP